MSIELELLSPARNKDIGIAAINCGADAVYIGGPQFGARQAAGNPLEEITELIDYAHKFGAKVYVVVNTILYEDELKVAQRFITKVANKGADAIIVQDLAVLKMDIPDIPLYASTQTNIRTPEQAKFLESLGFKRLILERGLSLEQIKAISEATSCELEAFVHGAICTSYSGQCYLSRRVDGRSANRGECVQACRSLYDLVDADGQVIGKNKAYLSLKDLCLDKSIEQLIDAGITSFKIEGRLKNSSYVQNITRWYRNECNKIISVSQGKYRAASFGTVEGGFEPNPNKTFNRGYTTYFINGERGRWSNMNTQKSLGEKIGSVKEVFYNNDKGCCFRYSSPITLANGDGLCILSPRGEIVGTRADKVEGDRVFTKKIQGLKKGLPIWRNNDIKFEKSIANNPSKRSLNTTLDFNSKDGTCLISAKCENGLMLEYTMPETYGPAKNETLAQSNIISCLNKKEGIYDFITDKLNFSPTPFIAMSGINQARRDIARQLEEMTNALYQERISNTEKRQTVIKEEVIAPRQQEYLNCSNSLSRSIYEIIGLAPEVAYDLEPTAHTELMRTKYCILYELGMCKKTTKNTFKEPLSLINNSLALKLRFECDKCEMVVIG